VKGIKILLLIVTVARIVLPETLEPEATAIPLRLITLWIAFITGGAL
jgi:hypothetical protein